MEHPLYRNQTHLEELSKSWRDFQSQCDFWITFSWPVGTKISIEAAEKRLRKFLGLWVAGDKRRDGRQLKHPAYILWVWSGEHYRFDHHRPHIHVLLKHIDGEIPSWMDIADGWRWWVRWDSPEACVLKFDRGTRDTFEYMFGHHEHYDIRTIDWMKSKHQQDDSGNRVARKTIITGARRLRWLASWFKN
jgi:hypothetical protein